MNYLLFPPYSPFDHEGRHGLSFMLYGTWVWPLAMDLLLLGLLMLPALLPARVHWGILALALLVLFVAGYGFLSLGTSNVEKTSGGVNELVFAVGWIAPMVLLGGLLGLGILLGTGYAIDHLVSQGTGNMGVGFIVAPEAFLGLSGGLLGVGFYRWVLNRHRTSDAFSHRVSETFSWKRLLRRIGFSLWSVVVGWVAGGFYYAGVGWILGGWLTNLSFLLIWTGLFTLVGWMLFYLPLVTLLKPGNALFSLRFFPFFGGVYAVLVFMFLGWWTGLWQHWFYLAYSAVIGSTSGLVYAFHQRSTKYKTC